MSPSTDASTSARLLVQICSYNSNLQGEAALPQDLVDWLSPTFTTSKFLARNSPPDIIVVGFQELLPLQFSLTGRSASLLNSRDILVRTQLEQLNKAAYSLVAKAVNAGVAMLVYVKDEDIAGRICDVQTQWTSCGPLWMGNKGAVGVRFRVAGDDGSIGEVFTFVNAHLTAHAHKLDRRLEDYDHIVRTLIFPAPPSNAKSQGIAIPAPPSTSTIFSTSHLFFFGDLNFRIDAPKSANISHDELLKLNDTLDGRKALVQHDQLAKHMRAGRVFHNMREGEFWQFPCSYKYKIGTVGEYSEKRTPSWTDRILYATYTDVPSSDTSAIDNLLYTSIPAYTTSDHKPITALLLLPTSTSPSSTLIPMIPHPPAALNLVPSRRGQILTRVVGKPLDWIIGWIWYFLWLIGVGNAGVGTGIFILGTGAIAWWKRG